MVRLLRRFLFSLGLAVLLASPQSIAQIAAPPQPLPDYKYAVGFGVSVGQQNDRDADFFGWSLDISRRIHGRWSAAAAIAWDREKETSNGVRLPDVDTFTLTGTVSYSFNPHVSLTTGLGKGIADTDNADRSMQFTNGDLGTGIALGIATDGLPFWVRDSINFSIAWEYNLDKSESSVSVDVGFGWSF